MNKVSTYYIPDAALGLYLPYVIFPVKFSHVQSGSLPPLLQNNKQKPAKQNKTKKRSLREWKQCDLEYCQREMEAGFEL